MKRALLIARDMQEGVTYKVTQPLHVCLGLWGAEVVLASPKEKASWDVNDRKRCFGVITNHWHEDEYVCLKVVRGNDVPMCKVGTLWLVGFNLGIVKISV